MGPIILAILVLVFIGWILKRRTPSRSTGARPSQLMRKLDRLTRDPSVSERLVQKVAFKHPEKSQRWCIEKAIFDIERDRGRA